MSFVCSGCNAKADAFWRERDERDAVERTERAMRDSGLPVDYRAGRRTCSDVPDSMRHLLQMQPTLGSQEAPGLFLFGESKTFKTTLAAAFLADAIRAGKKGRFVDVVDLMTDIQASYRDDDLASRSEIVERFSRAPLLVLDDLGQEKATHHAGEVLRQILDRRRREWRCGNWLIVTSNFTPEQLRDRFEESQTGNAILHRIAQLTVAVPMVAA